MSGSADRTANASGLVENYRFRIDDLADAGRLPGIGAFMRVKNGADFLEAAIRSHLPHLDEIVVVHNQCTDATPAIVARLAAETGGKVRGFHYAGRVHPPGSDGHAREPADSPASFVNQSNFALAQTRYRVAMKLDDDHVAMDGRLAALVAGIRRADYRLPEVPCFAGINLARDEDGRLGVLASDPFAGAGDHFFFEVTPETRFIHHPRFEDFHHGRRRVFADFTYWHAKALKPDFGFANRDIEAGNPRFARKRAAFLANRGVVSLAELRERAPALLALAAALPLPEKLRLKVARWQRFVNDPPREDEMPGVLRTAARA
jgi:glycosyltransferase involved in cell wall biosynthesis